MEQENVQDTGYDEFMSALEGDGYQTEPSQEVEEEAPEVGTQEEAPDAQEAPTPTEPEKEVEPEQPPQDAPAQPETFTLKVNKEERQVSREEIVALAQKGADYDRVKEQLSKQQDAMDVLAALAKEAKTDIPALLDSFRVGMLKKQGLSEETAKERLAREKAEQENARLKARQQPPAEDTKERARRELAQFREAYPKVELTEELVKKLSPDVQSGKSLTEAYRDLEAAEKDARIAQLERELAAEKQNKINQTSSPGSQKDSGGRQAKSDFDDFMRALE